MISRVSGEAVAWHEDSQSVEVEAAGLTYEIRLPTAVWRALDDDRPARLTLYTHYHVPDRQPIPVLIGFLRPAERDFFRKLVTVQNMGVIKAQRALAASVSTIAGWIEAEDRRALTGLPGIGARQADRIIAELRGKLTEEALLVDEGYDGAGAPPDRASRHVSEEAVAALVGLGYSEREAQAWVTEALAEGAEDGGGRDTEAVLRRVLQRLGSAS